MSVQLNTSNMIVVCNKLTKAERQQLDAMLHPDAKLQYIGSGACGTVYAFDEHRVFKIQHDDYDYPSERYFNWAAFCTKIRSKHVPKFDFIGRAFDGTVVTVMERLATAGEWADWAAEDVETFLNSKPKPGAYRQLIKSVRFEGTEQDKLAAQKLRTAFPARRAKRLQHRVQEAGLFLNDLHSANWMLRPTSGELVITDPIC